MAITFIQNKETETKTCSCGNELLLNEGELCDICMGVVCATADEPAGSYFTPDYFDELEAITCHHEMAA